MGDHKLAHEALFCSGSDPSSQDAPQKVLEGLVFIT